MLKLGAGLTIKKQQKWTLLVDKRDKSWKQIVWCVGLRASFYSNVSTIASSNANMHRHHPVYSRCTSAVSACWHWNLWGDVSNFLLPCINIALVILHLSPQKHSRLPYLSIPLVIYDLHDDYGCFFQFFLAPALHPPHRLFSSSEIQGFITGISWDFQSSISSFCLKPPLVGMVTSYSRCLKNVSKKKKDQPSKPAGNECVF